MGLDMYLSAKRYVSEYNEADKPLLDQLDNLSLPGGTPGRIKEIVAEAAYWRKANAIHKWFVDNVQNGEDECREHFVSREQLQQLLILVLQVLSNRGLATELLPTSAGFFFGPTEYDDWYWQGLENTRDQLTAALKADDRWDFFYRSSW